MTRLNDVSCELHTVICGLISLHELIRCGKSDSLEAERLRDSLDAPWLLLSPSEKVLAQFFSHNLYDKEISMASFSVSIESLIDNGFSEYHTFGDTTCRYYYKKIGCNVLLFDTIVRTWFINHMPIFGPSNTMELSLFTKMLSFSDEYFLDADVLLSMRQVRDMNELDCLKQTLSAIKMMVDSDPKIDDSDDYLSVVDSVEEMNFAYSSQKKELRILYFFTIAFAILNIVLFFILISRQA